ncbi:MAG: DMT family transporter [Christensenellaceae bacterium]|nr:DMT family transporter [Christensenellaceae bacterium]MCH5288199.1 DMT family transporter [Christensenellaceae bacterium]
MLYSVFAAVYGCLLSLMNTCNAHLSALYGDYSAAVMIHAVGLIVLLPLAFTWGRPRARAKWYQLTGGLIGILTLVFVNIGVNGVGVTGNLTLMLLGQVTASALVDHFALLGAERNPFSGMKGLAIAVMAAGCGAMLLLSGESIGSSALAAALSFLSGWTMVLARMANASLAVRSGVGFSTLMNYVTGLAGSLLVFALLGFPMAAAFPAQGQSIVIYLGGALGAAGIFLCNVVTPRLPALQMSLIVFVGQIFSGMLIDALGGRFSAGTLVGGLLVAAGMLLNARADRRA